MSLMVFQFGGEPGPSGPPPPWLRQCFFVTFLSLVAFQLGEPRAPFPLPLATPMFGTDLKLLKFQGFSSVFKQNWYCFENIKLGLDFFKVSEFKFSM